MISNEIHKKLFLAIIIFHISALISPSFAAEYFLRADTTQLTMPDGQVVPMWGFAQDSAFGAEDGTVTIPGPSLVIPPGDSSLIIHLDNNLPEAVSIVIHGQIANMTPVKFTDSTGRQRIKSFTHETASNNLIAVDYTWENLRPGTYMYQSGSHAAIQVPMGLYGCMKKDFADGQAYDGITYDNDVLLCFSEIDPVINQAVSTGNFGPGMTISSTINWLPKYFMINGKAFSSGQPLINAGEVNQKILLRFVNAGIESHSPILKDFYGDLIAEDGFTYTYPKQQYSLMLPSAKTKDMLIIPEKAGIFPIFDRRLRLTNAGAFNGGMLAFISISGFEELTTPNGGGARSADFNVDGTVDLLDLLTFTDSWMDICPEGHDCPANLNNSDNIVNFKDFAAFTLQFMQTEK